MSATAGSDTLGLLGKVIAEKYRVERVLGEGGSGVVYEATNVVLGEKIALKVVKPGDQDIESFQKEAKLLFSFSHANVVRMYDVGVFDSPRGRLYYLALELLHGRTLASDLQERKESGKQYLLEEIKRIVSAVLEALSAAHARDLIHRDIKPSNVMLCEDGSVKVLDFGTARAVQQQTHFATHFTPRYAAPEQWDPARGAASPATDVFGVGLLLYEMLTLQPALPGESLSALMQVVMSPQRPQLATHRPELAPVAQELITRSLALEPGDRYRDAGEFLKALQGELLAGRARQLPQRGATTPLVDHKGRPVSAAHTAYMADAPRAPAPQWAARQAPLAAASPGAPARSKPGALWGWVLAGCAAVFLCAVVLYLLLRRAS